MNRRPTPELAVETVEIAAAADARIEPSAWVSRAAALRDVLRDDDIDPSDLAGILRSFRFFDKGSVMWCYDGTQWWRWDGQQWQTDAPDGELRLHPFAMEVPFASFDEIDVASMRAPSAYEPTHVVPEGGAWAWETPDPTAAPAAQIDPGVDVMVVDWRDDGWAQVVCSNEWSAWLDGRRLKPL